MNKYRTKIGEVLGETFTDPEKYASRILPLAAIAETIATKGQGRNYAAEQQQGIYAQAARNRTNEQQKYQREVDEENRQQSAYEAARKRKLAEAEESLIKELSGVDPNDENWITKARDAERKYMPYKAYERDATMGAALAKKTAGDYKLTQNDIEWLDANIKDTTAKDFYLANPNEVQKIRSLKGQVDLGLKTNIPEDFNLRQYSAQSLRDESKARLIEQASGRFTSSQTYEAARQANSFLDAAEMAKTMDSTIGDQVLVKAVEKILQPESSVMQGEADAYRTAGTIIARVKESGLYDALMKGTEGRLPAQYREDLIAIARNIGKKRKNSFKQYRKNRVDAATNNYGWSKAEAEFAYPDPFDGLNIDPELTADDGTIIKPEDNVVPKVPTFNSEAEAEASGVKGDVIINGRKARID